MKTRTDKILIVGILLSGAIALFAFQASQPKPAGAQ
jgi:hypothetical protein